MDKIQKKKVLFKQHSLKVELHVDIRILSWNEAPTLDPIIFNSQ